MPLDIVLVTGPMVGVSSWAPTADRLRASGARVQVPDVFGSLGRVPAWRGWTAHLVDLISRDGEPILVGHSAASTLVADMATKIAARGLIIVDGSLPPVSGPVPPVRPSFRDFIFTHADEDGRLPPWSRWWQNDPVLVARNGLDILSRDAEAFAAFETSLPRMTVGWFNDAIELAAWIISPPDTSARPNFSTRRRTTPRAAAGRSGGSMAPIFIRRCSRKKRRKRSKQSAAN